MSVRAWLKYENGVAEQKGELPTVGWYAGDPAHRWRTVGRKHLRRTRYNIAKLDNVKVVQLELCMHCWVLAASVKRLDTPGVLQLWFLARKGNTSEL